MKSLLKNGFTRREDLDFTDDGSRFTAYEYNGLVITKATYRGEYYISVRVDYLKDVDFIHEDYYNKDWYRLADEFNGVREVDVDKLKENMDIIKKGVEELNEEIKSDPIDKDLIETELKKEANEIEQFLNENIYIDIMKFDEYQVRSFKRYFDGLKSKLDRINSKLEKQNYTRHDYKMVQKYNYLIFNGLDKDFYVKEIRELNSKN